MQCGVKRKHCPSLEHINLERQQQSLFDLSIVKLQQEQLRHGVEPRLLRFVLINNALRALQGHMFIFGDDDDFSFDSTPSSDRCGGAGTTESFLCNTFRDGGLPTTPTSPPTPVKVIKMETLSDQSPLVASTPYQSFVSEGGSTMSDDDEKDGARTVIVATPPPGMAPPTPVERMEGVTSCGEGKEVVGMEEERRIGEVLSVTMTTVEERSEDFSATIVNGDSPCPCGRVSLGKRKREPSSPNSDNQHCQCSDVNHVSESVRSESTCGCKDSGEAIKEDRCNGCSPCKKLCSRPAALSLNGTKRLNGVNGLNGLTCSSVYTVLGLDPSSNSPPTSSSNATAPSSYSPSPSSQSVHSPCSSEEPDEDSSTPSPIDFTKVDPTLYDYDTRAPLLLPTQESSSSSSSSPPVSDAGCHNGDHCRSNGTTSGGSSPSTTSPDSPSTPPTSSSLPPASSLAPPLAPPTTDDAPCSANSDTVVTSPTLAITATSTTFSLPPPSSEYSLISSSNHDRLAPSKSCPSSSRVDSNGIDCSSSDSKHSSPSSCSLEGLVSTQNGKLLHNEIERTGSENEISSGIKGGVPSSPEGAENDFLEDIDHIVKLLMT